MDGERNVVILGVGQTPFGEYPDMSLAELYTEPLEAEALPEANRDATDIDAFHYGNHVGGRDYTADGDEVPGRTNISAELPDLLDIDPVEVKRHEAACASSAAALESAYNDIAYGKHDVVAVGGSEKLASVAVTDATAALGTATAADMAFPEVFADITEHYADAYDSDLDAVLDGMAHIGAKNKRYGSQNPKAKVAGKYDDVTVDDARDSPVMDAETTNGLVDAAPLRLYDFCENADGGSAVILGTETAAEEAGVDHPITIAGIAQRSGGSLAYHGSDVVEPTFQTSRKAAAEAAYDMANVAPENIDIAEVHDCFTIDELKAVEDLGFYDHGEAYQAAIDGELEQNGTIPFNLSGGLIANGHPVGATGTRQITSLVNMLHGHPDYAYLDDMIAEAEYALSDTMGGDLGTSVVTVLKNSDA